ncbi:MAG: hypothetical protein RL477_865, partial [Pseudomonadota bacterium]
SLVLSGGDHMTFIEDRISLGLLAFSALFVLGALVRRGMEEWRRLRPARG